MNEILDLIQTILDSILSEEGIRCYWGRRAEDDQSNPTEYVIYEIRSDSADVSADGDVMTRMASIGLQYYVKFKVARTYAGRQKALARMDDIMKAMRAEGFGCSTGWFELGDVDDAGFATFRSEYEIPHFMENE